MSIPTDPATILEPPTDERGVLTGVEQIFTCTVAGSPLPTLTWYFNGELLEGDDERMINEYTLTIPSPTVEHSGMYQYFAANDNGAEYMSWTMQVREPGRHLSPSSPLLQCHSIEMCVITTHLPPLLPVPLSYPYGLGLIC